MSNATKGFKLDGKLRAALLGTATALGVGAYIATVNLAYRDAVAHVAESVHVAVPSGTIRVDSGEPNFDVGAMCGRSTNPQAISLAKGLQDLSASGDGDPKALCTVSCALSACVGNDCPNEQGRRVISAIDAVWRLHVAATTPGAGCGSSTQCNGDSECVRELHRRIARSLIGSDGNGWMENRSEIGGESDASIVVVALREPARPDHLARDLGCAASPGDVCTEMTFLLNAAMEHAETRRKLLYLGMVRGYGQLAVSILGFWILLLLCWRYAMTRSMCERIKQVTDQQTFGLKNPELLSKLKELARQNDGDQAIHSHPVDAILLEAIASHVKKDETLVVDAA